MIKKYDEFEIDVLQTILDDDDLIKAFNFIFDKSTGSRNPYHNCNHLLVAFKNAIDAAKYEKISKSDTKNLLFATLLHDINHSGGKTDDKINVDRSKKVIAKLIKDENIDVDIDIINELLDATEYPYAIDDADLNKLQKIIRDVDLTQMFEENWISQILLGLGDELNKTFDDTIEMQFKFANSVKYRTDWGNKIAKPKTEKHIEQLKKLKKIRNK
jgi:hypothetical protein